MDPSDIQWGTVADWLSGIGTVAAFAVTYRALQREIRQRRAEKRQERIEHARQLRVELVDRVADSDGTGWRLLVNNTSDQSFFAIVVHLDPPTGEHVQGTIDDVLPHSRHEIRLATPSSSVRGAAPPRIWVEYDDARGRRFVRDPSGIVEACDPPGTERSR